MDTDRQPILNSYGLLLTVLSLLCVVIYSGDPYDAWDFLLGGLAFGFATLYFRAINKLQTFELVLVSLIMSLGLVAIVFSIGEFLNPDPEAIIFQCENNTCTLLENAEFLDNELISTLLLSVLIALLHLALKKIRK